MFISLLICILKLQYLLYLLTKLWNNIKNGSFLEDPSILVRFLLITFADLKQHKFFYWFCFPAISPTSPFKLVKVVSAAQVLSEEAVQKINHALTQNPLPFFLVTLHSESVDVLPLKELDSVDHPHQIVDIHNRDNSNRECILGFADPCSLAEHPGWPLRNFLAACVYKGWIQAGSSISVLSLRQWTNSRTSPQHVVFTIKIPDCTQDIQPKLQEISRIDLLNQTDISEEKIDSQGMATECPKVVGWELNEKKKPGPRLVDLSGIMDPMRLAESSVNLNLSLMKWRRAPDLDLDSLQNTKCLLFGAGTLGCSVARMLLAWGIRHITFIDSGKVSFSNPVRQSLFSYDHCLEVRASRISYFEVLDLHSHLPPPPKKLLKWQNKTKGREI